MASGVLVISLLRFPFFFFFLSPSLLYPLSLTLLENCDWVIPPEKNLSHGNRLSDGAHSLFMLADKIIKNHPPVISGMLWNILCPCPDPVPFKCFSFFLFFLVPKMSGFILRHRLDNQLDFEGWGRGSFRAVALRILLRHIASVSKWCIRGRGCHVSAHDC